MSAGLGVRIPRVNLKLPVWAAIHNKTSWKSLATGIVPNMTICLLFGPVLSYEMGVTYGHWGGGATTV